MASHGTRFYDLRHFYSQLIAANLNPKVIQARPGHATVGETMDTYGHLFQDADDLGIRAIDDAQAAGESACRPGSVTRISGPAAIHPGLPLRQLRAVGPRASGGPPSSALAQVPGRRPGTVRR
jgi:hypothetical protein